jgi:hypothetical protein
VNAFNRLPGFWQWLICMLASATFCVVFKEGFSALTHQPRNGWDTASTLFSSLLIYNVLVVAQAKGYISFKPAK